jgi:hypothetical protein
MCYFGKQLKVLTGKPEKAAVARPGVIVRRIPASIPRRDDVEIVEGEVVDDEFALPAPVGIPAPDIFIRRKVRVGKDEY